MQGIFFTGTDTGVGKTFVTSAVARTLRQQGHVVDVCKPVVTGAFPEGHGWLAEDTRLLAEAAGLDGAWERVTEWSFPDPVAPPVAARQKGIRLELAGIVEAVRRRNRPGVPMLVEGVGGLLCPLTETQSNADLAAELRLPVVIVARRSLGTLNHTLLTLAAARQCKLPVIGVVVNETAPPLGLADETNIEELRRRIDVPILAVVAHENLSCRRSEFVIPEVDWMELCMTTVPRTKDEGGEW